MPAFMAAAGMPYWIDLMSSDVAKATDFYAAVLGWEISDATKNQDSSQEKDADNFLLARRNGLPVAGFIPTENATQDTWVTHFYVTDINDVVTRAQAAGAQVLAPPTQVSLGQLAILLDPTGGMFGLVQPEGEESFVAAGEPGTTVWHELAVTSGHTQAVEFYTQLLDWTADIHTDAAGVEYMVATAEGSPFAGIWDATGQFPDNVASFWQSYLGVDDIAAAADKVKENGGEVIRGPFDSGFGPMLLAADPNGATVTLCEVEPYVEEGHEGDPLEGIDLSQYGMEQHG